MLIIFADYGKINQEKPLLDNTEPSNASAKPNHLALP